MKIISILWLVLLLEMVPLSNGATLVKKVADTVIEPKALTIEGSFGNAINGKSFQQDAVATFNEYQYVGYYNSNRHVCIARRALPNGAWEKIELNDYDFKSNDAHNTISIGICPKDGIIHLAFDHHNDPLRYRVSEKFVATNPGEIEWKSSLFGSVSSELEPGKSDDLYLIYAARSDGNVNSINFSNGDLVIASASSITSWNDWRIIHVEKGPFVNEMLGDVYRWKKEGILSVLVQEMPSTAHESTALRLLDFRLD